MAVQNSTTVRNALLNVIASTIGSTPYIEIWSGSVPAACATASSGTKLASFHLVGAAGAWNDAASAGSMNFVAAASLPLSTTGLAGGTAGYYRVFASDDSTCHEQGTVTATGGGGDATIDNTTISASQTVQLTGFTKTAPGA